MGNFTNIMPAIDLKIGALAEFEAELEADFLAPELSHLDDLFHVSTEVVLASTQYPLSTACLDFHAGTYGTLIRTATAITTITAVHAVSSNIVKGQAGKRDNGLYSRGLYIVLVTMGLYGWM
jgi:hypothetical protein